MKKIYKIITIITCSILAIVAFAQTTDSKVTDPISTKAPGSPYDPELLQSPKTILTTNTGTIIYSITNQYQDITMVNHGLDTKRGLPAGVTQAFTSTIPFVPVCGPTFTLKPGETCYLVLNVDGTKMAPGTYTGYPVLCADAPHQYDCYRAEDTFTFSVSGTPIPISVTPSGCDTLKPGQTTSWTVTNLCPTSAPFSPCDSNNLIAYNINVKFSPNIDTFIDPSSINASQCAQLVPGQSCTIFATVNNTTRTIDGVTGTFQGVNTTAATDTPININPNTEPLAPIGPSAFFINDVNTQVCNTYQNCSNASISPTVTTSGVTGVNNVAPTNTPPPDCIGASVAPDALCQVCFVAPTADAFGSGQYTISYTNGPTTGGLSVAPITLTMNNGQSILIPDNTGTSSNPVPIKNNGNFDWQGAALSFHPAQPVGLTIAPAVPGACALLAPGAFCNFTFSYNSVTTFPTTHFVATGTNVSNSPVFEQILIAGEGAVVFLGDTTTGTHLQYREIIIDNSAGTSAVTFSALTLNATIGTFTGRVYTCTNGDANCDYPSTCNVGDSISAGATCSVWLKSLTPPNQAFTDIPQGTVAVTLNGSNTTTFTLAQQVALYATGFFNSASADNSLFDIAKWDGTAWRHLDYWNTVPPFPASGTTDNGLSDTGNALAVCRGDLCVGGDFIDASGAANSQYLARWNGALWSGLSTSSTLLDDVVNALSPVVNPNGTNGTQPLYFGGELLHVGTQAANRVGQAVWNVSSFSVTPLGNTNGNGVREFPFNFSIVYSLLTSGTSLYTGGSFNETVPGVSIFEGFAKNIALWDGTSMWSPLFAGVTDLLGGGAVYGMTSLNGQEYVAGSFDVILNNIFSCSIFPPLAVNVAAWNPSTGCWSGLDTGFGSAAYAVTANPNTGILYAGGAFVCGGTLLLEGLNHVAQFVNGDWKQVGQGLGNSGFLCIPLSGDAVYVLKSYNNILYAGGVFNNSGSTTGLGNIAFFDGNSWQTLGGGVSSTVIPGGAFVNDILITSSILIH